MLQHLGHSSIKRRFKDSYHAVLQNGDSEKLLKKIPSESIDLVVTSPPYNLGKEYETRDSIDRYLQSQEGITGQLVRVLKPTGSICWQVGNFIQDSEVFPLDIFYYNIFKNLGLKLRNRIIWHFGHGLHTKKRLSGRYETILWFTKTDDYIFNLDNIRVPAKYPGKRHFKGPNKGKPSGDPNGKNPSDVWEFITMEWGDSFWQIPNVKANHPEKTAHPCQFPVELVERCVLALTKEGDWVLDPFVGSGSTMVAALKHARKAIGIDIERRYVRIAEKRIKDLLMGVLKTRPLGKPIFEPNGTEKVSRPPDEWLNATKTGEITSP